jgi:L-alanine-DL-glutamate epimerase-like enolase superfamily enzyme
VRATTWLKDLTLRYPFGISRGSVSTLPTVLLRLEDEERRVGLGEASPVRYLGFSAAEHLATIHRLAEALPPRAYYDPAAASAAVRPLAGGELAALAAVDIALWDLAARDRGLALHRILGAPPPQGQTSYTIALDPLERMEARAREAAHLPLLKVKLGRDPEFDRAAIARVASAAPKARLRVDANGGWSLQEARSIIPYLADHRVEMVEQPLRRGSLWQLGDLRRSSPLPIFADEDVQGLASLGALRGRVDGINIKLMKAGGITEALAMIAFARREGWSVLLGCMIESRIALAAAAELSGMVDELDLDAHMLTTDDPVSPGSVDELSAEPPALDGPGIGVALDVVDELGKPHKPGA